MMADLRKGLKVFGLAAALSLPAFFPSQAGFAPAGSMMQQLQAATALPIVDVQARRPVRRPVRTVRRKNNGAAVAGALVGAAIIGGAIIANSEAQRRERRRAQYYYYGEPQPQYYYGRPQPQYYYPPQRRVYRQDYYYQDPSYYQPQPRTRYRQPPVYRQDPYAGGSPPAGLDQRTLRRDYGAGAGGYQPRGRNYNVDPRTGD